MCLIISKPSVKPKARVSLGGGVRYTTPRAALPHWSTRSSARSHAPVLPCSTVRLMATGDTSSFSFALRLVHLSTYTFVELSFGITQLLRTSAAIDTMLVPEAASRLRDDPLTQSLIHQVGVFHVFVGLTAYMLRDQIIDQRASARPFYMGMVFLQFALLLVVWQAEQAGLTSERGTMTTACLAAVFGGGAVVALWRAPPVDDYDVEVDEHGVLTPSPAPPSERTKHE